MADLQVLKALLPDNPLCGIDTNKDTLNLATGACTRQIYKLVLDGSENFVNTYGTNLFGINAPSLSSKDILQAYCSHYVYNPTQSGINSNTQNGQFCLVNYDSAAYLAFKDTSYSNPSDFKTWLAEQYSNNTPVIVYYVLRTPTTETIALPSGLSGTEEGYLTQSGTPTPSAPIYPTANTVNVWQHSLRKMSTATEAVENPLYADGTAISTYTIKGNTTQSGTPSPSNPVAVNGVGERTENLLFVDQSNAVNYSTSSAYAYTINSDRTISISSGKAMYTGFKVKVSPNTTYTLHSLASTNGQMRIREYSGIITDWNTNFITQSVNKTIGNSNTTSFTTTAETEWVLANWYIDGNYTPCTLSELELLEGEYTVQTLPTYEPYGYEIPISSGQTVNNYLGSIQSTRQIQKLVLTGQENWHAGSTTAERVTCYIDINAANAINPDVVGICSHIEWKSAYAATDYNRILPNSTGQILYISLAISVIGGNTMTDFVNWITAQYANGTPVTVWYVLSTATTGVVNEPLMKIGDYADTLSNATAIPTVEGANTITIDTTVQPSEFTATWTGWHDAYVKEYDGTNWQ
jgi:hypothetical protein